jgi:hypothetical protein
VFYIYKIILIDLLPPTGAVTLFLRDEPNLRQIWAKSLFSISVIMLLRAERTAANNPGGYGRNNLR